MEWGRAAGPGQLGVHPGAGGSRRDPSNASSPSHTASLTPAIPVLPDGSVGALEKRPTTPQPLTCAKPTPSPDLLLRPCSSSSTTTLCQSSSWPRHWHWDTSTRTPGQGHGTGTPAQGHPPWPSSFPAPPPAAKGRFPPQTPREVGDSSLGAPRSQVQLDLIPEGPAALARGRGSLTWILAPLNLQSWLSLRSSTFTPSVVPSRGWGHAGGGKKVEKPFGTATRSGN